MIQKMCTLCAHTDTDKSIIGLSPSAASSNKKKSSLAKFINKLKILLYSSLLQLLVFIMYFINKTDIDIEIQNIMTANMEMVFGKAKAGWLRVLLENIYDFSRQLILRHGQLQLQRLLSLLMEMEAVSWVQFKNIYST